MRVMAAQTDLSMELFVSPIASVVPGSRAHTSGDVCFPVRQESDDPVQENASLHNLGLYPQLIQTEVISAWQEGKEAKNRQRLLCQPY
jgi:hypothetical protein